jgi:hypothetical protein
MSETAPLFALADTKISFQERALGESRLIEFCGRNDVHTRRKAVDWWFTNRQSLGLRLCDFLLRCRWSDDRRTITFLHPQQ